MYQYLIPFCFIVDYKIESTMTVNDPGFSYLPSYPPHENVFNQKTMVDQWVDENIFGNVKKSLIYWISSGVAWIVKSGFH